LFFSRKIAGFEQAFAAFTGKNECGNERQRNERQVFHAAFLPQEKQFCVKDDPMRFDG
jgi:hypothetical protein